MKQKSTFSLLSKIQEAKDDKEIACNSAVNAELLNDPHDLRC